MKSTYLAQISGLFLRPTREYFGGVIAGCGVGALLARAVVYSNGSDSLLHPLAMVAAFLLIAIGAGLAQSAQRKRNPQGQAK